MPGYEQNGRDTIRNSVEHTHGWVRCFATMCCLSTRENSNVRRRLKFYEQHVTVQTKFRETRGHLADPGIGPIGIFSGPGPEISSDYRFYDRLWDGG